MCWASMEMLLLLFNHTVSQLPGHGESTGTQVWEAWTLASAPLHLPPSRDSGVAAPGESLLEAVPPCEAPHHCLRLPRSSQDNSKAHV